MEAGVERVAAVEHDRHDVLVGVVVGAPGRVIDGFSVDLNGWLFGREGRDDILKRDLTNETFRAGTNECIVLTGTLAGPFTGAVIEFVRGNDTSPEVFKSIISSPYPMPGRKGHNSWGRISAKRSPMTRLNLLAVDGPTNASKGDSDAATWLPPNKAFRCEYVALQTAVKAKYGLWMTQAEHDAVAGILTVKCPDQPVPDDDGGVEVPIAAAPAPEQSPDPAPGTGSEVGYENCTAVREADADPISVGDPGWDTKFDGDGVICSTAVKAKYGLWMTQAEHDAVAGILTTKCPNQPVPDDDGGVSVPVAATPTREESPEPAPGTGSDVSYENCTAVREADADPISVGDPGWDTKFDGDGVICSHTL
ncbi:excalibur calcium-binding domain-containing protein [Arthrobacter sp. H14]|uniref:excalibur calcium-binding domain-containing protein n=1 Tax=Arthrobacter sp. H14 TaxID=1312959 RepID=UPI000687216C|nr:excalibur calcium-binding domain-containing protein [Arthrobacter sp. H14]